MRYLAELLMQEEMLLKCKPLKLSETVICQNSAIGTESPRRESSIQRLADRYALWFTPITLAISGLGWLVTQNPQTILSVLVVATPCSLIFATPVVYYEWN